MKYGIVHSWWDRGLMRNSWASDPYMSVFPFEFDTEESAEVTAGMYRAATAAHVAMNPTAMAKYDHTYTVRKMED